MIFHLPSILYSILFLGGLELVAFGADIVLFIAAAVLFLFSFFATYTINRRALFLAVPVFFTLADVSLLFFIDPPLEKHAFVIASTLIYYLALLGVHRLHIYRRDQTARGMIVAVSTVTTFFFYTASYGVYLNFVIPVAALMTAYFLITALISANYFLIIAHDRRRTALAYSFVIALGMAEIAWAVNFWPFGYLTTGVISLIFYYILWDLAQSYFLNLLSQKRVIANVVFFTMLAALVLLSSRWLPAI